MNSLDEFVTLVRDEIGLALTAGDVTVEFDRLPGWDSVLLLRLVTLLERETGRGISFPDVLEAPNLARIYDLAVAA
ncbi:phosphopantetheine-binding protein [Amycolatopsis sp. NPDC058278]|jgi:hypothetical protein|uniref:phosphopantetheine-binding protein n=1 Tax=unclassified Amycolatopsis TaxID=2618356 RepID=UPI00255B8E14|nr:phosphopantetheine-binding protein [Amycolatopsis sp. DG1A-15b]WIX91756.1 phosphopantetheine-binding protein [Amycolatopsis sp. DG1A-15b]